MEGRPWLRIVLILIVFSLLGIPVWSMTHQKPVETSVAQTAPPSQQIHVEVTFAEAPTSFRLEYLGETICLGAAPQKSFSGDWKTSLPPEGIDLLLKAEWPSSTEKTAVRVQVTRAEAELADQTFWSDGSLVESVTVPGK